MSRFRASMTPRHSRTRSGRSGEPKPPAHSTPQLTSRSLRPVDHQRESAATSSTIRISRSKSSASPAHHVRYRPRPGVNRGALSVTPWESPAASAPAMPRLHQEDIGVPILGVAVDLAIRELEDRGAPERRSAPVAGGIPGEIAAVGAADRPLRHGPIARNEAAADVEGKSGTAVKSLVEVGPDLSPGPGAARPMAASSHTPSSVNRPRTRSTSPELTAAAHCRDSRGKVSGRGGGAGLLG